MSNQKFTPQGKDPLLWAIAQKRASFKKHAISYSLVNIFLWAIWYFSSQNREVIEVQRFPWPIWTTLGWGIGLAFHYAAAYVFPTVNSTEREYQHLKNNQ